MKTIRNRLIALLYIFLFVFFIIIVRVGCVQVVKGEIYVERAFELWTRNIPVSTQRGKIFDRNGKLIVGNKLAPTIAIIPKQVKNKRYTINALSTILKIPPSELEPHFNKNVCGRNHQACGQKHQFGNSKTGDRSRFGWRLCRIRRGEILPVREHARPCFGHRRNRQPGNHRARIHL